MGSWGGLTMMDRRQLFCAAAAGAAILGRVRSSLAATYDLIIRSGRVIAPSLGINAIGDVAIAGGRIVAVEPNIPAAPPGTLAPPGQPLLPRRLHLHPPPHPPPTPA